MERPYNQNLFSYLEGLGQLPDNSLFRVELDKDYLFLFHVKLHLLGRDEIIQKYQIQAADVVDLGIVKQSEIQKQSVVGRGVVGGVLFGPVGAMLGAMSATGKQKIKNVFAVSYLPSQGTEAKTIMFDADPAGWTANNTKWVRKVQKELATYKKSDRLLAYLGQSSNADGSITL